MPKWKFQKTGGDQQVDCVLYMLRSPGCMLLKVCIGTTSSAPMCLMIIVQQSENVSALFSNYAYGS